MPPSFEELKRRLSKRGTETADVIEKRMSEALGEIKRATEYDYIVVNGDIDKAVNDIVSIIEAKHLELNSQKYIIDEVLEEC